MPARRVCGVARVVCAPSATGAPCVAAGVDAVAARRCGEGRVVALARSDALGCGWEAVGCDVRVSPWWRAAKVAMVRQRRAVAAAVVAGREGWGWWRLAVGGAGAGALAAWRWWVGGCGSGCGCDGVWSVAGVGV